MFLKLEKVTRSFGGVMALHRVDLEVREGEIVGLIGPNGSGKTTLFSVVTGFLKPDAGRIVFMDKDVSGWKPNRICRAGLVRTFQVVRPFLNLTVLENVTVGSAFGRDRGGGLRQARQEAADLLDYVGLGGRAGSVAADLTLPQRKRLELARALAGNPRLLLLDEVMAGLNQSESDEAMELVRKIRDSGVTIIMVEHNVRAVVRNCDRLVVLASGLKIAEGPPQDVVRDPGVVKAYLGDGEHA